MNDEIEDSVGQEFENNLKSPTLSSKDIDKLLKNQLITELTKRNLITTGTVPVLKK